MDNVISESGGSPVDIPVNKKRKSAIIRAARDHGKFVFNFEYREILLNSFSEIAICISAQV